MKKGFTLVEMLVVVAILAIVAAIAVPMVSSIGSKAGKSADSVKAQTVETAIDSWMDTDYSDAIFYRTNLFTSASVGEATASRRAASSVATVFVCYEENCAELFDEAGAVNHMFVTADAEQALSWAKHSLSRAEENNYLPVDEGERQQFFDDAGKEQFASVWVYRDKNEFAKESYGICVDSFDLSKSKDLLSSMFA